MAISLRGSALLHRWRPGQQLERRVIPQTSASVRFWEEGQHPSTSGMGAKRLNYVFIAGGPLEPGAGPRRDRPEMSEKGRQQPKRGCATRVRFRASTSCPVMAHGRRIAQSTRDVSGWWLAEVGDHSCSGPDRADFSMRATGSGSEADVLPNDLWGILRVR
jgi:hypothetical protein